MSAAVIWPVSDVMPVPFWWCGFFSVVPMPALRSMMLPALQLGVRLADHRAADPQLFRQLRLRGQLAVIVDAALDHGLELLDDLLVFGDACHG